MTKNYYCFTQKPNDITFEEFKQGAKEKGLEINPTGNIYKNKPYIAICYIPGTIIPVEEYLQPEQIGYEFTSNKEDLNKIFDNGIEYIVLVDAIAIRKG